MGNKYHPVLSKACNAIENKDYDNAIKGLEPFVDDQDLIIKQQANALMGLCYFRLKKNIEAEFYFNQACNTSKNFTDWFNLASAAALNGHLDLSKQAFNQTISYCKNEESKFIPKLRFYYINALLEVKAYEIALEQLNILWESYIFYSVTDDHFLYVRGLPFFAQFMETALDILNGMASKFDNKSWFAMLYASIDEEGKEVMDQFKSKLIESDNDRFEIKLPLHLKDKPLLARVEDLLNDNGKKHIVCRVLEGTLKLKDFITLKKHNGQSITGKCSKLEISKQKVKEMAYKSIGVVYLEGINIDEVRIGDLLIHNELLLEPYNER